MCRRPDGGVDVRDSEHPETVLYFTKAEFAAWLDGVARHEFRHLAAQQLSRPRYPASFAGRPSGGREDFFVAAGAVPSLGGATV
jgi:hypothetical protein